MSDHQPAVITVPEALSWMADLFAEQVPRVQETTARKDLPGWDSMGQLVLMAGLDERFGIRLTDNELATLSSVADILDILRKHGFLR